MITVLPKIASGIFLRRHLERLNSFDSTRQIFNLRARKIATVLAELRRCNEVTSNRSCPAGKSVLPRGTGRTAFQMAFDVMGLAVALALIRGGGLTSRALF
jgi:hypothetical protein